MSTPTTATSSNRVRKAPAQATAAERAARGKAARAEVPRSSHAEWDPSPERPDPIALLEQQAETRVQELVPIRYGRMSVSPFTFYRGAARVMASDLSQTPRSGITVQLCGDAHLVNFGVFASPERSMIFDLNDFDETLPGPWEWDVKRLTASLEIAGRDRNFSAGQRRRVVAASVKQYRDAMRAFSGMTSLHIWYARVDESILGSVLRDQVNAKQAARAEQQLEKARRKDSTRAFTKLATTVEGEPRIVSEPPLIVPIGELMTNEETRDFTTEMRALLRGYAATLQGDRRRLLDRYGFADMARKVVGVGSVGTRCWIVLMIGRDRDDPLFLQCKEADRSVLAEFVGDSRFNNEGRRVVEGQRLMQAASDTFLGWVHVAAGLDHTGRDFYVRQLWDSKGSADIGSMAPEGMEVYGRLCGWTLARAHARSGDSIAIGSYLGSGDTFDRAIVEFSAAYADQTERDHAAMVDAIKSGRLKAVSGL
jgi:uncharacterized protein (DUF2252 family)